MEPEFRPIAQTFLDIGEFKFADHELIRKYGINFHLYIDL